MRWVFTALVIGLLLAVCEDARAQGNRSNDSHRRGRGESNSYEPWQKVPGGVIYPQPRTQTRVYIYRQPYNYGWYGGSYPPAYGYGYGYPYYYGPYNSGPYAYPPVYLPPYWP